MNHQEFTRTFYECEQRERLFDYSVKGRNIWDYVRYPVFYYLLNNVVRGNELSYGGTSKRSLFMKELAGVASAVRRRFGGKSGTSGCDILVVNYTRTNLIDGKNVNIHFYPLIKALHDKYRIILLDPSRYQVRVEENYPCEVVRSISIHYRSKLKRRLLRYSESDERVFHAVGDVLRREYNCDLDIEGVVAGSFAKQLLDGHEYKKLFRKIRPKVIIHTDTGVNKGWMEEAHSLGIPIVEFQHSIMSDAGVHCNYPEDIVRSQLKTLPDYIFSFGEFWHDHYKLPSRKIAVGFPFVERKISEVRSMNLKKDGGFVVISSIHSGRKLEKLALDLSKLVPDRTIYYKLRCEEYADWRNVYSREFQSRENIVVVDNDSSHLYEYFARASFQIGINSTALVEGMMFGLGTYVLKDGWYAEMQSLIDAGYAHLVTSAEDIVSHMRGDSPVGKTLGGEALFKSNSIANISNEIDGIVNSSGKEKGSWLT